LPQSVPTIIPLSAIAHHPTTRPFKSGGGGRRWAAAVNIGSTALMVAGVLGPAEWDDEKIVAFLRRCWGDGGWRGKRARSRGL